MVHSSFFKSIRQKSITSFMRYHWFSRVVKAAPVGSSVQLTVLEPSVEDELFRVSSYEGRLIARTTANNGLSITLRQIVLASAVERTFYLNSTNLVHFAFIDVQQFSEHLNENVKQI